MTDPEFYRKRFEEISKAVEAECLIQEMLEDDDLLKMSAPGFAETFFGDEHDISASEEISDTMPVKRFRIKN